MEPRRAQRRGARARLLGHDGVRRRHVHRRRAAVSNPPVRRATASPRSTPRRRQRLRQPEDPLGPERRTATSTRSTSSGSALYVGGALHAGCGTRIARNHLAAFTTDTTVDQARSDDVEPERERLRLRARARRLARVRRRPVHAGQRHASPRGGARPPSTRQHGASATSWNPQRCSATAPTPGTVYSLEPSASTMYMSGLFRTRRRAVDGRRLHRAVLPQPGRRRRLARDRRAEPDVGARRRRPRAGRSRSSPQGLVLGGQFDDARLPAAADAAGQPGRARRHLPRRLRRSCARCPTRRP